MKKLAIVADWLPTYGGAEHVVQAWTECWSGAPVFTTVAAKNGLGPLAQADIRPHSVLQFLYTLSGRHQWLLPWMPQAIEQIDLAGYDIVLSSSHAIGKGIIPPQTAVHVCYCHTPMRYAWEMEAEYLKDFRIRWPMKKYVKRQLKRLRRWDLSTARRVDHFIANSTETQRRIRRIYARDSVVIPPPVEDRFFRMELRATSQLPTANSYFLALGRLVPYKRFDLLITLANELKFRLKIAGTGSEIARLRSIAGPTVEFIGFVPEQDVPRLYMDAEALLFPQIEDAGIVPMEAQACGTPIIGLHLGGLVDVVKDGLTGVLIPEQTLDAFAEGIKRFRAMTFDRSAIREHARQFHERTFQTRMRAEVEMAAKKFGVLS